MEVEFVRRSDLERQRGLDESFHLRHLVRVDREGGEAVNMQDGGGVDAFGTPDSIHFLIIEGGGFVGGTHLTPLDRLNLLQTAYSGLVQGVFPDHSSLGADWTHFDVVSNRREDGRRTPESAALFFSAMEHALEKGRRFLAFGVPLALIDNLILVDRVAPFDAHFALAGLPTITRPSTACPPSGRIH